MKIGTLFSGFGGVDIGAQAAGLDLAWSIEYDADIADVARRNLGDHVITADILTIDPATMPPVDVLHASPPCPNFSVAKTDRGETEHDLALARKVAEFIRVLSPQVFTLENVYGYRKSESWSTIRETLNECGYWHNMEHVNAADFVVPQTRKRMIVRAVRGGWVPYLPQPVPWVGWYAAIEDLIPTLPESKLANWQIDRLPDDLRTLLMSNDSHTASGADSHRYAETPAQSVTGERLGRSRAVLVGGANTSKDQAAPGVGVSNAHEPSKCINTSASMSTRALLVDGKLNDNGASLTQRDGECRTFTVTTSHNLRDVKAALIDVGNTSRDATTLDSDMPSFTITAWHGRSPSHAPLAVLPAVRVVAMTPRCLARFQSFPDWYKLPDTKSLAAKGIGNAVPPLLYQRIIEQLI